MDALPSSSLLWADLRGTFTPFAIRSGIVCLVSHCAVFLLLRGVVDRLPSARGPWSRRACFTAHQLVTLPVLAYLTVEGMYLWIHESPLPDETTPMYRLTGPNTHGHLSEFVLGMMFFWDIPVSFFTSELRQPAMLLHHVLMFLTAAVALGLLSEGRPLLAYYAPFFFGAVELSSLPLLVVDLFHPKHEDWHRWLTRPGAPRFLSALNEVSRIAFAVLFLLVRTVWFPYVSVAGVLADIVRLDRDQVPPGDWIGLCVMAGLNMSFSALQMYWGSLVVRQIAKLFRPPPSGDKKAA